MKMPVKMYEDASDGVDEDPVMVWMKRPVMVWMKMPVKV